MKRTSIRRASQKRSEAIPERQELRRIQLSRKGLCEARIALLCQKRATDVHEVINRSQRGTAWLEQELFVSLCRACHRWVTDEPLWSRRHGLSLSSWQAQPEMIARATQLRGNCTNRTCSVDHMEIETNG